MQTKDLVFRIGDRVKQSKQVKRFDKIKASIGIKAKGS